MLDERAIDMYRSAMTERHTFVVRWFFRFFRHVGVDSEQIEDIRKASEHGTIVYVMRHRSLLDYLYFNHLFLRRGLPLARYANEINMLPILPLRRRIRTAFAKLTFWLRNGWLPNPVDSGYVQDKVATGTPVLLFLQRRPTFSERLRRRRPSSGIAEELILAQRRSNVPVKLVPLVLFWSRRPETVRKNIWDAIFGESEHPGRIRKVVSFLRHRRRAVARIGDPLDLSEFLNSRPPTEELAVTAKRVRWACLHYIYRERRVVAGARQLSVPMIAKKITNSKTVRAEIARTAKKERKPPDAIHRRAEKMVHKIAADVRWNWLLVGDRLLTWVWNNIYSGVDVDQEGIRKIKRVSKDHPVVLIPSHKSHTDYMILSYVFHHQDMNVPYIAAGENLSFWPVGKIFRRMGAFFIRRRFAGDALYSAVFERYVHTLLKGGQTIEFFIEGGRSRTGRVLKPRLGLLGMIVRAWQAGVAPDIYLVPINVSYETLIEERDLIKELEGGKKEKESATGLFRLWRVFTKRYGRVAVEISEPISMLEALGTTGEKFATMPEPDRRAAIKGLGDRVAEGINAAAVVTAASLIAAALLAHGRRGCMAETLTRRALVLHDLLLDQSARFSPRLQANPHRAMEQAAAHFVKSGALRTGTEDGETYFVIEDDQRIALDLYKNMTLHFFAPAAMLATALLADGDDLPEGDYRARYRFLRKTLRLEFAALSVEDEARARDLEDAVRWLVKGGVLDRREDGTITFDGEQRATLEMLRGLIKSILEGYVVATKGISGLDGTTTEAALVKRVMASGKRMYRDGFLDHRESLERPLLANAIKHLIASGVLLRVSDLGNTEQQLELDDRRRLDVERELSAYVSARLTPVRTVE